MIRRLPEAVVARIAAGEVVVRPSSAVKELVENALDARSGSVCVVAENGGVAKVVVQDDGCGIHKDDFILLCERFTTSKLRQFEDLAAIATLGFRGEALCSISHVAHLTVVSNGHQADYHQSTLLSLTETQGLDPTVRPGTRVEFEDLFFNQPVRRRSLGSTTDEYRKIVHILQRFAVHFPHVAFQLRKSELAPVSDVTTSGGQSVSVSQVCERLFGVAVADLVPVAATEDAMHLTGVLLRPTATSASGGFFSVAINGRLVEAATVRKVVEDLFAAHASDSKCLAVLNLQLPADTVDINVHPTKKDVLFANKDGVLSFVRAAVKAVFAQTATATVLLPAVRRLSAPPSATAAASAPQRVRRADPTQATLVAGGRMTQSGQFVWVGEIGDCGWAAVQRGDELLLVDVRREAENRPEMFDYQFHYFQQPLELGPLIRRGLQDERLTDAAIFTEDRTEELICARVADKLRNNADLRIQRNGESEVLTGVAVYADMTSQEDRLIAALPRLLLSLAVGETDGDRAGWSGLRWFIETASVSLLWELLQQDGLVELSVAPKVAATLAQLYREFERC